MIRRSRQSPSTSIRADVRVRFLQALKRVIEQQEAEDAAGRRAFARAAAKAKGERRGGWRSKRGADITLSSSRRRSA